MSPSVLASIEAEATANPMGRGAVPLLLSRTLLADGDALAYAAAGNDDTPPGRARHNLLDKIASAKAVSGAGAVKILTTAEGSHKGFRFAVARAKPYQGHRVNSRRPKNWAFLRSQLETGMIPDVELTTTAEADDLFGKWSTTLGPENVVIYTEDKDMRMVPGWHLDWKLHTMHYLPQDAWAVDFNDKLFGRKWFWQQMLQGDSADNVPGLPWHLDPFTKRKMRMGPVTAEFHLKRAMNDESAFRVVSDLYQSYYGEQWAEAMLEQGILLWMRTDPFSSPFDVMSMGNPLDQLPWQAKGEMQQRIAASL